MACQGTAPQMNYKTWQPSKKIIEIKMNIFEKRVLFGQGIVIKRWIWDGEKAEGGGEGNLLFGEEKNPGFLFCQPLRIQNEWSLVNTNSPRQCETVAALSKLNLHSCSIALITRRNG